MMDETQACRPTRVKTYKIENVLTAVTEHTCVSRLRPRTKHLIKEFFKFLSYNCFVITVNSQSSHSKLIYLSYSSLLEHERKIPSGMNNKR